MSEQRQEMKGTLWWAEPRQQQYKEAPDHFVQTWQRDLSTPVARQQTLRLLVSAAGLVFVLTADNPVQAFSWTATNSSVLAITPWLFGSSKCLNGRKQRGKLPVFRSAKSRTIAGVQTSWTTSWQLCTNFLRLSDTEYKMFALEVERCLQTASGAIDGYIY